MNRRNIAGQGLDSFLKQTLKDDMPPDAEARMYRRFRALENDLTLRAARAESRRGLWGRGIFRKEIMAFASAVLLIAGGVLHLGGNQSALAHSLAGIKAVVTVSSVLLRAASMDCVIVNRDPGQAPSSYRVRWGASGVTRVDMQSVNGLERTLWIRDETGPKALYEGISMRPAATPVTPADPVWKPALEFLTPAALAEHMEARYGLVQAGHRDETGRNEVLLVGRDNQQVIEIAVDVTTYLPITLKKYRQNPGGAGAEQTCVEEILFQWNQPIPAELLTPKVPAASK